MNNNLWYPDWEFYEDTHHLLINQFGGFYGMEYNSDWFRRHCIEHFTEIINQMKNQEGDIYTKAAHLLISLTRARFWADGQKRTAYITSKTFVEQNGGKFAVQDPLSIDRFMRNLTFKYSDLQVEMWIRDGEVPL